MSVIGKTAVAVTVLAVVLGLGWLALDHELSDQRAESGTSPQNEQAGSNTPAAALPDAQWIAEMHASVQLLSETLATTGNVGGAIALIDVLDARIARQSATAAVAPLRSALARDRQKLVAARAVDITAAAASIDQLVASVDSMPLISAPEPLTAKPRKPVSEGASASRLDAVMQAIRERFADVVRIRKVENPEAVFLTPEQGALIAERLRLRLLSAKLALVSRQEQMFAQDIAMSESILAKVFDPQDARVVQAKASLASLKSMAGRLAVSTQLQSVDAIEQLKAESAKRQ